MFDKTRVKVQVRHIEDDIKEADEFGFFALDEIDSLVEHFKKNEIFLPDGGGACKFIAIDIDTSERAFVIVVDNA